MGQRLYDTDFYAWTQQQAEAIREAIFSDNRLDRDNLAEEIESLGVSQRSACESHVENIIEHLLKIEFVPSIRDVRGWRKEVRAFRKNLEKVLSPSLRAELRQMDVLSRLHTSARRDLIRDYQEDRLEIIIPESITYDWDQITQREPDWFPEPRYAARQALQDG